MRRGQSLIKIGLSVLLIGCIFSMPYGYYELVRFTSMIIFGWLAYKNHKLGKSNEAIAYISLAVLFQPIFKIYLGREIWVIVDIIVATFLVYSAISLRVKQQ